MAKGNKKILLIDDDGDFVASTRAFLQGRGYEVDTAANGTEGWQKIQAGAPDLIVLDIMMDYDAEGFNLAYKLRQDDATGKTTIIIVSGFSQHLSEKMTDFEFVLGQDWPADAYFEKPIQLKELAKSIDRIISNPEGRVAAEGTH
jgi:DNA-binding response OmpR family regulator